MGIGETHLNIIKATYYKPTASIALHSIKQKGFHLRPGNKSKGCHFSQPNIRENLGREIRHEKEIKAPKLEREK